NCGTPVGGHHRKFRNSSNHWGQQAVRRYVQGTWDLARAHHPSSVPEGLPAEGPLPFAPGPAVEPIPADDARAGEVERTLRMNFENYALGRLMSDRRNYDMEHAGPQAAVAHVRGVVWALGWWVLSHTFAWEKHHSPLNAAGSAIGPSRLFSSAFGLRGVPQS